jgi:hypothetical protein
MVDISGRNIIGSKLEPLGATTALLESDLAEQARERR